MRLKEGSKGWEACRAAVSAHTSPETRMGQSGSLALGGKHPQAAQPGGKKHEVMV